MRHSPWMSEPELDHALQYTMDQDPQGDDHADVLGCFLNEYEVSDSIRKDEQFWANVSLPFVTNLHHHLYGRT